jgi:hypothetical protein
VKEGSRHLWIPACRFCDGAPGASLEVNRSRSTTNEKSLAWLQHFAICISSRTYREGRTRYDYETETEDEATGSKVLRRGTKIWNGEHAASLYHRIGSGRYVRLDIDKQEASSYRSLDLFTSGAGRSAGEALKEALEQGRKLSVSVVDGDSKTNGETIRVSADLSQEWSVRYWLDEEKLYYPRRVEVYVRGRLAQVATSTPAMLCEDYWYPVDGHYQAFSYEDGERNLSIDIRMVVDKIEWVESNLPESLLELPLVSGDIIHDFRSGQLLSYEYGIPPNDLSGIGDWETQRRGEETSDSLEGANTQRRVNSIPEPMPATQGAGSSTREFQGSPNEPPWTVVVVFVIGLAIAGFFLRYASTRQRR